MNAKQLFSAAALVLVGTSAFAAEGEQWVPSTGSLTRTEVQAELARAQAAGEVAATTAAYSGFAVAKSNDSRTALSREFVRSEARAVAHSNAFSSQYVGG